jgi:hypothetical protein
MWSEDRLEEAERILEEAKCKKIFTEDQCLGIRDTGRSLCTHIAPQTY